MYEYLKYEAEQYFQDRSILVFKSQRYRARRVFEKLFGKNEKLHEEVLEQLIAIDDNQRKRIRYQEQKKNSFSAR